MRRLVRCSAAYGAYIQKKSTLKLRHVQHGVAATELVIVLPVLMLLLIAAHWLFSAQFALSGAQLLVAQQSFLSAQLSSSDYTDDPVQAQRVLHSELSSTYTPWPPPSVSTRALPDYGLAQELKVASTALQHSELHFQQQHRLFPALALRATHTLLAGSPGASGEAQQVRARIKGSPSLWDHAASASSRWGQRIDTALAPIDRVWNRGAFGVEWLAVSAQVEVPRSFQLPTHRSPYE